MEAVRRFPEPSNNSNESTYEYVYTCTQIYMYINGCVERIGHSCLVLGIFKYLSGKYCTILLKEVWRYVFLYTHQYTYYYVHSHIQNTQDGLEFRDQINIQGLNIGTQFEFLI